MKWYKFSLRIFFMIALTFFVNACGFHFQGKVNLAPQLHRMYIQASDPYSYLVRTLKDFLKLSNVQIVNSPKEADTILVILQDAATEEFLGVSGTQQTRQYNLHVTVQFEINTSKGVTIVPPQTLTETRGITIQLNEMLGSSNEVNLFYQQMRRTVSMAIIMRIASRDITHQINMAFSPIVKHPHEN